MALTEVNSIGIKNADIKEEDISISNAPSDGYYLQYKDSTDKLTWAAVAQYSTPLTTRGDILFRDASGDARLAKGTNGQFLKIGANDPEWADVAAGAVGGSSDKIFWENGTTVTTNYTITNNMNAMSAGPITINNGATVTIGDGETWTIV